MFPFRLLYYVSFLTSFLNGLIVTDNENSPLKIIIHMGTGTRSHIKGILEIASILSQRNHTILYASLVENEKFSKGYPFVFKPLGSSERLEKELENIFFTYYNHTSLKLELTLPIREKGFSVIMGVTYETIYPTLKDLVEIEKPDLIICDYFSPACGDVAEMKKVPFINGFQTIDGYEIIKTSFITSDNSYGPITTDEQSFLERFQEKVIIPIKTKFKPNLTVQRLNKIKDGYGVPTSTRMFKDFDRNLGLSVTFEGFEPIIPLPPNIKVIGPIFSESVPQLDPDLTTFLDSHQRIMYIGFGSDPHLFKPELDEILISLLRLIENDIIDGAVWGLGRIGLDDFSKTFSFRGSEVSIEELFLSNHTNLRFLPWAPQVSILNHHNIKLFLSHGGLESILESIHAGKPILAMSLESDQPRNARKLEIIGIGQFVDRSNFTSDSFVSQVSTILEDKDSLFSSNLERLKILSKFSSRRKYLAADLVEGYAYTAKACRPSQPHRWGEVPCEARHLVPISHHMSFIKSDLLDVYFFAFFLALGLLSLLLYMVYKSITSIHYRIISRRTHAKYE